MASPHAQSGVTSRRPAPVYVTRGAKRRITRERCENPSFADYLRQIETSPLLDAAGEKLLGHLLISGRPANGGEGPMTLAAHAAREGLITANLRLVIVIAACYADQGVALEDIISAGNIGLIRAVDKYIPGRARFGTHATWWIREACSRYVMGHGPMIYIPRNVLTSKRRMARIASEADHAGELLDADELVTRAALTPSEVARATLAQDTMLSLDMATVTSNGDTLALADTIADESGDAPDVSAVKDDAVSELYRMMATALTRQERQVLALRFGLGDRDGAVMSNADVALELGVNREKVRALELAAISKLRDAYDANEHPERLRQALMFRAV